MCRLNAGYNISTLKEYLIENGMQEDVEAWWPQDPAPDSQAAQVTISAAEKRKGGDLNNGSTVKRIRMRNEDHPVTETSGSEADESSTALVLSLQERVQILSDREKQLTQLSARWVEEREQVKQELAIMKEEHKDCELKLKELEIKSRSLEEEVATLKEKHREDQQTLTDHFKRSIARSQDVRRTAKYRALKDQNRRLTNMEANMHDALQAAKDALADISTTLDDRAREVEDSNCSDDASYASSEIW